MEESKVAQPPSQSPKINHVVGHFKVKSKFVGALSEGLSSLLATDGQRQSNVSIRRRSNFVVVKDIDFTYNVFTSSGHVNVYRITDLDTQPEIAISRFCRLLLGNICAEEELLISPILQIVNITAAGKLNVSEEGIDLYKAKHIYDNSNEDFFCRLNYNPDIYAGLSFKSTIGGTINLFAQGSYTILGAKSKEALDLIHLQLCAFIQTL